MLNVNKNLKSAFERYFRITFAILVFIIIIANFRNYAQSFTQAKNYVHSQSINIPVNSETGIANVPENQKVQSVSYYDNLGRLIQTTQYKVSPAGYDVITPVVYNEYGIQDINYLPYTANTSGTYVGGITSQASFYSNANNIAHDTAPYSKKILEQSPLLRVLEQGAPGETWQPGNGHSVLYSYESNNANEVPLFSVSGDNSVYEGFYSTGKLYKTVITDENGNHSTVFTDMQEREIMKVAEVNSTAIAKTLYIYDDFGNLKFIISPEAMSYLETYGYSSFESARVKGITEFKYDGYNRQIEKIVPEEQPVTTVYDKAGRVILRQDGLFGNNKDWLFTKYDRMGRTIMTGVYHDENFIGRDEMQPYVNGLDVLYEKRDATTENGYTNNSFPILNGNCDIWTINYYDDYDFTFAGITPTFNVQDGYSAAAVNETIGDITYSVSAYEKTERVKNKVTKTKVKVILPRGMYNGDRELSAPPDNTVPVVCYKGNITLKPGFHSNPEQEEKFGPNIIFPFGDVTVWLETLIYYDKYGRVIQTQTTSSLDETIKSTAFTQYDFSGKVLRTKLVENFTGSSPTIVEKRFIYDHAGRVLDVFHKVGNSSEQQIVHNDYNELGQLINKKMHFNGIAALQEVNYEYNIRGWLKNVNDPLSLGSDLFAYSLDYYNSSDPFITSLYNGNISAMKWKHQGQDIERYYYDYDKLGRLTSANFREGTAAEFDNRYKVNGITYDLNGNIQSLTRNDYNGSVIDALTYTYINGGNMLQAVNDGVTDPGDPDRNFFVDGAELTNEYEYDDNGNMKTDRNKGIKVMYNYLNLPSLVTWDNSKAKTWWLYTATGEKIRSAVYDEENELAKSNDYVNGFVYKRNDFEVNPVFDFLQFEEGRYLAGGTGYEYHLKDHLGNVRATFDETGNVLDRNFYYPFGITIHSSLSANENRYLYNNKEYETDNNLNWYHYGARFYDPQLGRWHTMDPADEFNSPYLYVGNNPVIFIDPDGTQAHFYTSDGIEIATILVEGESFNKLDVKFDRIDKSFKPIIVDIANIKQNFGLDKVDAVGFGVEGAAILGGGIVAGIEVVYFLNSKDQGQYHLYGKIGVGILYSGGLDVYTFGAMRTVEGSFNHTDWEGEFNSWSVLTPFGGLGYFWANTENAPDLFDINGRRTTWKGIATYSPSISFDWNATWFYHWGKIGGK